MGATHARADLPPGGRPAGRRRRAGPDAGRLRAGQAADRARRVSRPSCWPPARPEATRGPGRGPGRGVRARRRPAAVRRPRGGQDDLRPGVRPGARHRRAGHQPDVHPRPPVRGGRRADRGAHAAARRRLPARPPRARSPTSDSASWWRTAGVALVEWGDAAEPVLGAGALSLLLEVDPDDEGRRRITVTGAGAAWDDRWDALVGRPRPVGGGGVKAARPGDGHRPGGRRARARRRRRWPSASHLGGRAHAELLAPAIEEVCALSGCALGDLDALAVDVGPGLFTGLRVGVATAKALGQALGLGVLGGVEPRRPGRRRRRGGSGPTGRPGWSPWSTPAGARSSPRPTTSPARWRSRRPRPGRRPHRPGRGRSPRRAGRLVRRPGRPPARCWWSGTVPSATSSCWRPGRASTSDWPARWPPRRRPSWPDWPPVGWPPGAAPPAAGRRGARLPAAGRRQDQLGGAGPAAHGRRRPPAGRR